MAESGKFKFCTSCGAKLDYDMKFCTYCGTPCAPVVSTGAGAQAGAVAPMPPKNAGLEAFTKGQQYFLGDGTKQDFAAAQQCFTDAAKAGHVEAPIWVEMCQHYREIMEMENML